MGGMRAALLGPRLRRNLYKIQTDTAPVVSDSPTDSALTVSTNSWVNVAKPTVSAVRPPPGLEGLLKLSEPMPKRDSGCDSSPRSSPPLSRKQSLAANFDRA